MLVEYKDFNLLEFSLAEEKDLAGIFTGKAAVYGNVDCYGDIIVPGACTKSLADLGGQVVVLAQHMADRSIGMARLRDASDALYVDEGRLELGLTDARDAYLRLQRKMLTGISIGYMTLDSDVKSGVRYLKQIELLEVSLVTFPANDRARVLDVKSRADLALRETERWFTELKAGRMLSAANLTTVKDCRAAMAETMLRLDALIAAAEPEPGSSGDGPQGDDGEAKGDAPEVKEALDDLLALRHAFITITTAAR